ncbi:hypothetical protein COF80_13925 [Bacillus toyonensis]|uniref:hypothetical protein n=1 Tax=Bacillus toyonensis TaxID=155322 RepID=UPI000BF1B211|nr:hypothetical protein [Bacillus toyonensis]PEK49803.1 hypothetical protein CN586_10310 [Bacillus toyonensis]PHE85985.1 hypothetical protein COF80_13925 [Bacillus toyonensis]
MGKLLKLVIPCICLMTVIIFASKISYASKNKSEPVQSIALKDYQYSKSSSSENVSFEKITTSSFSLPIYETISAQQILNSSEFKHILLPTNEKLWFIMKGEQPEGLIVANDAEPIRMGGENRSKDLYELYKAITNNTNESKNLSYFEFEGQGILIVNQNNDQEIYLSKGAAAILKLPAGQKIVNSEVIQKMKERIVTAFE